MNFYHTFRWCEFDGIAQQVPDDLLKSFIVGGNRPDTRIEYCLDANILRLCCRTYCIGGCINYCCRVYRAYIKADLTSGNPRDIKQILNQLRLAFYISFY